MNTIRRKSMKINLMKKIAAAVFILFFMLSGIILYAKEIEHKKPGRKETCPVCGMFVSLYPDWIAWASGQDGSVFFFDGVKDMFKFIRAPEKWAAPPGWGKQIQAAVTDYYTLRQVDATKAFYVIGSDVLGPMGHELIPLASKEDAEAFLKEHKGRRILTFDQVTPDVIKNVDQGIFK